jgi:hypothetical protein
VTMAYPIHQVRGEVAFLAYHFHWALDAILELPHRERGAWVGEVSKINQRVIDATKS